MDGQFVEGGCCLLDFYLWWTIDAVFRRDPDAAYKNARLLTHSILALTENQRRLEL